MELLPVVLVISIFAMAGVYDLLWRVRPDYFRVQSGVNFLPLDLAEIASEYSAYTDTKALPDLLGGPEDDAAVRKIKEIYEKFRIASVSLASKKAELARRLQREAAGSNSFFDAQWAQYAAFVAQKTAQFAKEAEGYGASMQTLLTAAAGAKSADDLPPETRSAYYSLSIKRAEADLQRVKAEAEVKEYGLRHLTDFQKQPYQQDYVVRLKETQALQRSISDERDATNALHQELGKAIVDYRNAVRPVLGYGDFLYFSVGAATTATFGDISPNKTVVRLMVCGQVLISVLITGVTISRLAEKKKSSS